MKNSTRFQIAIATVLTLGWCADSQCQPSLSESTRQGLPPGKAVELLLHGDGLEGELEIWCATAARIEEVAPSEDGKQVRCQITVAPNAPLGVTGLVVANAEGASDPLMVMVDDMDSVLDKGANHSVYDAQAISTPIAVDGRNDGVKSDYYRFRAQQGERISIEVVAQRIGSSMDPVVRLLDAQHQQVALADDDAGLGADCRLQHVCTRTGDYYVEIRDNRYQAGGSYRLRVGDFPILTSPLPLGGRRGSTALYRFAGTDAKRTSPLVFRVPDVVPTGWQGMAVRASGGVSSAIMTIVTSDLPEFIESEPHVKLGRPTRVNLPCAVSGILQSEKDEDSYEFALTKGQKIVLTAYGRRLRSPTFVFMTLYDSNDNVVAKTSETDVEESTLSHTAAADGVYRLATRDLLYRGGPCFTYRIELRNGPDFSLALKHDQNTSLKPQLPECDGTLGLTVEAQRRGYDGPIRLELDGAAEKLRVFNSVIPAKATVHRVYLAASSECKAADLQPIRLVGIADVNGRTVRRHMRTEATLRAKMPHVTYPPRWYDGLITTTTVAAKSPLFGIRSDQEWIELKDGSGEYVFHLERKEKEFEAAIVVLLEGLPPSFEGSAKAEKNQYTVTLSGDAQRAPDEFKLRIVTIGEHKGRGQTLVTEIPVRAEAGGKDE